MKLFSWLFKKNNNTLTCPRCLGKGKVDNNDIKRLNMELKWAPGKCAYCNGTTKVSPQMIEDVAVDEVYLTLDLSSKERKQLLNKEPEAIMRAINYSTNIDTFIEQIRHLYFVDNINPDQIAIHILSGGIDLDYQTYQQRKNELVEYINKIVGLTTNQ